MLTADEPTFEGLAKLFSRGHPSLGIFSGEGGAFIGGHGMNDEAKLRTATGLSNFWDGEPIRRVRATDGSSILVGRRLSLHLRVQPAIADLLLTDEIVGGQGLLSRMLMVRPASLAGTRFSKPERSTTPLALARYDAHMQQCLRAQPRLNEGKHN